MQQPRQSALSLILHARQCCFLSVNVLSPSSSQSRLYPDYNTHWCLREMFRITAQMQAVQFPLFFFLFSLVCALFCCLTSAFLSNFNSINVTICIERGNAGENGIECSVVTERSFDARAVKNKKKEKRERKRNSLFLYTNNRIVIKEMTYLLQYKEDNITTNEIYFDRINNLNIIEQL